MILKLMTEVRTREAVRSCVHGVVVAYSVVGAGDVDQCTRKHALKAREELFVKTPRRHMLIQILIHLITKCIDLYIRK
jgi:hypothetical protein